MAKLTEYADAAATEYLRETGKTELEPHWLAEFFQDCGVLDEYPRQDLVAFHSMVQKELTRRALAIIRPTGIPNSENQQE